MLPPLRRNAIVHRTAFATAARRYVFWIVAIAASLAAGAPALASDAKVEHDARALQKSAVEEDYLNMNYAGAIRKLETALNRCGSDKCGGTVKATLLRDLGAMQILGGSADEGKANFARALQLDSSIDLDPAYKNPMLDGVWNDAKKKPKESSAGAVASGDFSHTPPAEALVRTPLPIYVEYPAGDPLGRVLVKYKGADMADWKTAELKKLGDGYGGLIPCKDVAQGTMQYFIQGFDPRNDPVAMSGSRTAPFTVEVTPQISGPPPSLPGRPPPSPCGEAEAAPSATPDCPPDFPGCNAPKKEVGAQCVKDEECSSGSCADAKCVDKKSEGQDCESDGECSSGSCSDGKCSDKKGSGAYCERDDECASDQCEDSKCAGGSGGAGFHRFWLGIAVAGDFYVMPGATNACKLNSAGTKTLNTAGYNCVDPSASTNFPADQTTNNSIAAGTVQSGLAFGNVRLLASADYALTKNALVGVRGGYVLRTDPAKGTPGAAFAPVHLEARVTYLFGRDALVAQTLSPMVLGGVGLGEFDASIPVSVGFSNMTASRSEDAWVTAGPFFVEAGGGARLKLGAGAAATGALKIECAFGGTTGVLFGFAPELGVQLGF
jgi:hypothetical protein